MNERLIQADSRYQGENLKIKFTVALLAAVAGLLIVWIVIGSRALASADNDRSAIVALNQELANSFKNKDLDAALAYYSDDRDAVFYEDDTFELKGRNALRKNIQAFFAAASHIQAELWPITVVVDGDLAATHFTVLFS